MVAKKLLSFLEPTQNDIAKRLEQINMVKKLIKGTYSYFTIILHFYESKIFLCDNIDIPEFNLLNRLHI